MLRTIRSIKAAWLCPDYKPQPLTWRSFMDWSAQYRKDRRLVERLFDKVIYLSESKTKEILVAQNEALMRRLVKANLPPKKWIYVSVHDAGSSSPVMLNILRDAAKLEKIGCTLLDAHNTLQLTEKMNALGAGALIYVDDFIGTGNQFCSERDFVAQNFVLNSFSEFIIAPAICEEAYYQIGARGVEAYTQCVHAKVDRPLHENSNYFNPEEKERLISLCRSVNAKGALGYKDLATMVVLYRNAPNTVPVILRGSTDQKPFTGLFPRTTDFTAPKING